ncbi:DUF86 domain-containing protein [Asticcacaulis sp. AND118]|uniref:HepT-like ribonuclease domain-containing protein n=1 Tax=Asticcacaulis sp. AND118 TaxID=2840468 RepID=UPI001CFFE390|nr:HepT-like ribonuclease domain-containing protein [Asticcacaulis sp. AND118]UDF03431.1 DUF86 domain-containing protein [Asticcacaulis sp. AND118]
MRSERERQSLIDIAENIDLAVSFAEGLDEAAFATDLKSYYAVVRCLEIISEASRTLSDELKARHPELPWKQIAGSGNIYRHDYGQVAHSMVWITLHRSLPSLKAAVDSELG